MYKAHSEHVSYELHTLGWKAFENLCATITSEIWGQTIQTFFDSHDGGRDGAFHGRWEHKKEEFIEGSFTCQCKFTSEPSKHITASSIKDELAKAERLAKKHLCDNYILFTNAKLKGTNDESIRELFEKIPNIKKCLVIGRERITQIIHESSRLRMLVPRIYGLGDLSQILDERAYRQAQEVLSSMGDDLNKFIITDAYRKSAAALSESGFVFLIGEPMCGKSTIAASLSLSALDNWQSTTIKVTNASDFKLHFNPNEKQLIWVDDVFGSTQLEWDRVSNWNQYLAHLRAAVAKGTKVIFTSRDYIFKSAKRYLKSSAFPLINDSQVVIQVENLTKQEKEQILYNHIKLGSQKSDFKTKVKPFLEYAASLKKFSPELARRLGEPLFTKKLNISNFGVKDFITNPLDLLCEIIETMDDCCRSALAFVFMRGGQLSTPISISNEEELAISRLGGSVNSLQKGIDSLSGSLLINTLENDEYYWKFKHPTVRDAIAKTISKSNDFIDIYISGAPVDQFINEVSCGDVGIIGIEVIIPKSQFSGALKKISQLDKNNWSEKRKLYQFLAYRCSSKFLETYLSIHPNFIESLNVSGPLFICTEINLFKRLNEFNLLSETFRKKVLESIYEVVVEEADSGCFDSAVKSLMSESENSNFLQRTSIGIQSNWDEIVKHWQFDSDGIDDPETHYSTLKESLEEFKSEYTNDNAFVQFIDNNLNNLDEHIEMLNEEYIEEEDNEESPIKINSNSEINSSLGRSVFDDVDK